MKFSEKTVHQALALAVLAGLTGGLAVADTIYVNDNWGAAPTKSDATFPYEDKADARYFLNVQDGKFYSAVDNGGTLVPGFEVDAAGAITATPAPAEDGAANGPDYRRTGIEYVANAPQNYFDNSAIAYNQPTTNVDDPTTAATESLTLTLGVDAFASLKDAIDAIGSGAAAGGNAVDRIVVLSGIYYEALVFPRNNNIASGERTTTYYAGRSLADFDGKMENITIIGDPVNRPVITRGAYFDGEHTDGATIASLRFTGLAGVGANIGTGVHSSGYAPSGGVTRHNMLNFFGSSNTWPDPGIAGATAAGYRKDFTIRRVEIDGQGIRVPFGAKSSFTSADVTTAPAFNDIVKSGSRYTALETRGEYGTLTITDNTFKGLRGFGVFDTNAGSNNNCTWTQLDFLRNTIDDVWGSMAFRGEDITAPAPEAGRADLVNISSNTVRNLGMDLIQGYAWNGSAFVKSNTAPFSFILDHKTEAGGAFKLFNHRVSNFTNNSILNVNTTRDWFTKAVKVDPGHPDYIPMGAAILVRDLRDSNTLPDGPWPDYSTYNITGNLFEACQQGIAVDPPGNGKFVPNGIISGNSFIRCRTGIYLYDGVLSSLSFVINNNVFAQSTNDPLGTGITAGSNVDVIGAVVFDENSNENSEGAQLDVTGNYFDGPDDDIQNNSPTLDAGDFDGTGELPVFPNLDNDGDGLSNDVEAGLGLNPNKADTDGDGLPDGVELRLGTDPNNAADPSDTADADGDKLSDAAELLLGLNPNNPDSDGDGIRDDYELLVGTNGNDATSVPSFGDANEDGITDNVDAVRIIEAFLNINVLNTTNKDRVDLNRDGVIDNVDAIILFNKVVGNISYIPFP